MNEIVAHGKKYYILGAGNDRPGSVDLEESAPWGVKVCEDRLNPMVKVQTVNKSTQSSGTIIGEVISNHHLDRRPGNMAINCQTDEDANKFARTRFMKRIRHVTGIDAIWPEKRNDSGGNYIYFPDGTFLLIQGPGENNAQSFTASAVWNDEPYLYDPGRMLEFANRVGAMWNGKVLNTSVGAKAPKTDLDTLYQEGTQEEWNHRCLRPGCGKLFLPMWWKTRYDKYVVQWDRSMEEGEATNYAALGETIRIVCPHCGERHPDTRRVRKELTSFARAAYVQFNPKGNPTKPSYRWNKISPWGYTLAELVEKFLKALEAKRVGNMTPIEKFVMMDMAETYNRLEHETVGAQFTIPSGDYKLEDVDSTLFRNLYPLRIMSWDKQDGANARMEGVCRAYGRDRENGGYMSRLVWTGTEENERKARDRQIALGVMNGLTAEDCAHLPDDVYVACREYGWIAMIGAARENWDHSPSGVHQTPTIRPYSTHKIERGCYRFSWSGPRIKEAVFIKRTQQGMKDDRGRLLVEKWGLPSDTPQPYLKQINQRKILKADGTEEWPEGNDHRHDCECMIETLWQMYLDGLFPSAPKLE